MRLKSLTISNLYCFGDGAICNFISDGSSNKTLVVGINNDDAGMDSNGSGKSSIPNIIYWVLFGELFQKEGADDILRNGTRQGHATLELVDGDGKIMSITRRRGKVKKLELLYADTSKTCDTDSETQKQLLKYLGIVPSMKSTEYTKDYLNTTYFSTATVKSFMSKDTTSKDRFDLIARFLSMKKYDTAAKIAKSKKEDKVKESEQVLAQVEEKRKFVSENNEDIYADKIKTVEADIVVVTEKISEKQKLVDAEAGRLRIHDSVRSLEGMITSKKASTEAQLQSMQQRRVQNDAGIIRLQEQIRDYNAKKADVDAQIQNLNQYRKDISDYEKQIQELGNAKIELVRVDAGISTQILNTKQQLTNQLQCPECKKTLMLQNGVLKPLDAQSLTKVVAELDAEAAAVRAKITTNTQELVTVSAAAAEKQKLISDQEMKAYALQQLRTPVALQADVAAIEQDNANIDNSAQALIAAAKIEVAAMTTELGKAQAQLQALGESVVDVDAVTEEIKVLQQQKDAANQNIGWCQKKIQEIKTVSKEMGALEKEVAAAKTESETYAFWEMGFKNMKMMIIDDFLPTFMDSTNYYLQRMQVGLRVEFNTEKEKTSATKKDKELGRSMKSEFDISVFGSESGDARPFNMFSNGERGRISSCVGMALRTLTLERGNNVLDFMFLDEIADALDSTGLGELIKLLDDIPGQKIVISHNDEFKNYFDDIITVEKSGGVSMISN